MPSHDTRITADWKTDRKEYMRQKKYIQLHPECSEVPPKRGTTIPTWLIDVDRQTEPILWQRQYQFLRKNPDAEYMPSYLFVKDAKRVAKKNMKEGRTDNKHGTGYEGCTHIDTRITVRRCQDPVEYKRQLGYLLSHPDCLEIPPRKRMFATKNRAKKYSQ